MTMLPPLKAELFKYRKRKQLSTDGSIAGIYLNTFLSGLRDAIPGPQQNKTSGPNANHFELYDPIRPRYEWSEPDYQPPPSWFDGVVAKPPLPERIAGHLSAFEEPVRYEQSLIQSWMIEQIMLELMEMALLAAGPESPRSDSETSSSDFDWAAWGAGQTQVSQQESWDESIGTEPPSASPALSQIVDALLVPEMGLKPTTFLSEAQSADEQQMGQSLEALVQEAVPQQDPQEMQPDPYEQERMLYDQQMQQLLNPFMMLGFGPGP